MHTSEITQMRPDAQAPQHGQPLRIAYVVHTFDTGGLERCVAHLCNHLDRDRFEPMIICLNRSGTAADWLEREVPIVELSKRTGNDFRVVGRLTKALKDNKIDIVHSHNWGTLLETAVARRRARTPAHIHAERGTVLGTLRERGLSVRLRGLAMKWALPRVDVVLSNAESTAQKVAQRCGYDASRIHIIPNGVAGHCLDNPQQTRSEFRSQLGIPDSAIVVGSVGRLQPVKQFELAIKAIARLHDNVHLILVGDGPLAGELTAQANRANVSGRVHLVGHHVNIGRWLDAFDIFVNTSLSEGMSQSILEAMAAGLPMVVTDVGDSKAMVAGADPCGLVVCASDVDAFAASLKKLVDNPDLRAETGRNAVSRHDRFYSFSRMISAYEAFYADLTPNADADLRTSQCVAEKAAVT